ncbi:MAG: ComEA family DNA-binding protein [Caldilineaceae bacterium]|nr:ComEA family DNA-binding protein [Caldilineaceae bacterium]MBP8110070.1 ComEA family DNA-binding protein [Caldilineaceae bacterium]MBP8125083.1 ComEA family DNA-binding protein [Caldilineaceae bacterium]MBP9073620.1 ComEA family DNA-binding protein [Caldilineaceae bacterium]
MPHSAHPLPTSHESSADTETSPGSGREGTFHLYSFLLGLLTSLLLVGGTLFLIRQPTPQPIVLQPPPTPMPTPAPTASPTPGPITVFVSGGVMTPGLVELPATARAGDAITAAGGLAPGADEALVNQAQPLWDGAQVHVPTAPAADGGGGGLALSNPSPPTGVSGEGSGFTAGSLPGAPGGDGRININTASAAELETLPGVGPSRAQAIIDNRPFASVEDLERVPGIGPKTLESLIDLIRVN